MRVILKNKMLVLAPENEAERSEVATWKAAMAGHVFALQANEGDGLAACDLGAREEACREPINISSKCTHPAGEWISNFAEAPFTLDGRTYRSVEGFWQGLKFEKESERRRIAQLFGGAARRAGEDQPYGETVTYEGLPIRVGTWEHWALMERACRAKFEQHAESREALLSTGDRPLEHRMRRDSKSIPGAIMAAIWMRIRKSLRESKELRIGQ